MISKKKLPEPLAAAAQRIAARRAELAAQRVRWWACLMASK